MKLFLILKTVGILLLLPFLSLLIGIGLLRAKKVYFNSLKTTDKEEMESSYRYVYSLVNHALLAGNFQVKIRGIKNIPNQPTLFVCNHKSNADPLVFLKAFKKIQKQKEVPYPTFVAKHELLAKKRLSYVLKLIECVFIDRNNLRTFLKVIEQEKELLTQKQKSVVVFIEGTRVKQAELGEFKAAALEPAYNVFCPIVPVVIYGTLHSDQKILSQIFKPKSVSVEFLSPIKQTTYLPLAKEEIARRMRRDMAKTYQTIAKDPLWKVDRDNGNEA